VIYVQTTTTTTLQPLRKDSGGENARFIRKGILIQAPSLSDLG
jgi:hypothetical protein